jgi:4-diphosphocytidyl-2C-methyl-D-erythritol kinase
LRVVGRRVDGYHDLESVVVFADGAAKQLPVGGGSADAAAQRLLARSATMPP